MANHVCETCAKQFSRRGNKPYRYCSRECFQVTRPRFDVVAWYAANREAQNAKRRAWAIANPEKRRAIRAKWQAKNRVKLAADAQRRRDIRRAGASVIEMEAVMAAAEGLCTYCGHPSQALEFDHLTAITKGGTNSLDNLLPCCRTCNSSKGNRPAEDWLFDKFGLEGLGRAIYMVENRKVEPAIYRLKKKAVEAYYPGVKIVEVR